MDMLLTGELSHHDALAAIEKGRVVVAPFHSNTERGYLHDRLKTLLHQELVQEWNQTGAQSPTDHASSEMKPRVEVSTRDRDPYQILPAVAMK